MEPKRKSDGLPPNFDELPVELQRVIEERVYRRQLRWTHGYRPGSPCLRSIDREGVPLSGSFGRRVDESDVDD